MRYLWIIGLVFSLSACGVQGALYLPHQTPHPAKHQPAALQHGK